MLTRFLLLLLLPFRFFPLLAAISRYAALIFFFVNISIFPLRRHENSRLIYYILDV